MNDNFDWGWLFVGGPNDGIKLWMRADTKNFLVSISDTEHHMYRAGTGRDRGKMCYVGRTKR